MKSIICLAVLCIVGIRGGDIADHIDDDNNDNDIPTNTLRLHRQHLNNNHSANNILVNTHRILQSGCYETYEEGISYPIGGMVSATSTSSSTTPTYTLGSEGQWELATDDSETIYYNYKCNSILCGDAGYGPGESGESLAWTKSNECDATLPTLDQPIPDVWEGGPGCPLPFNEDETSYDGGDVREVDGIVYRCAEAPQNIFCTKEG